MNRKHRLFKRAGEKLFNCSFRDVPESFISRGKYAIDGRDTSPIRFCWRCQKDAYPEFCRYRGFRTSIKKGLYHSDSSAFDKRHRSIDEREINFIEHDGESAVMKSGMLRSCGSKPYEARVLEDSYILVVQPKDSSVIVDRYDESLSFFSQKVLADAARPSGPGEA